MPLRVFGDFETFLWPAQNHKGYLDQGKMEPIREHLATQQPEQQEIFIPVAFMLGKELHLAHDWHVA